MGSSARGSTTVTTVSRIDEPGQVVDVAVRVVAGDAPAQPDHVADAEVVGEDPFDARPVEPRVACLNVAQQAFLGGQQGAPAIDVDRAPFHDDAAELASLLDAGHPERVAQMGRDPPGKAVVVLVVGVLGPAIELPVDQVDRARQLILVRGLAAVSHEERRGRSREARRGRSSP